MNFIARIEDDIEGSIEEIGEIKSSAINYFSKLFIADPNIVRL